MLPAGPGWRRCLLLALLVCAVAAAGGCNAHNPVYFPHYFFPFGEIEPTHAKPGGPGYFANFDPKAARLEVRPIGVNDNNVVNQVRSQHVLLATIYDPEGQPRRNRRVEWIVEGVGNIIEVDESGTFHNRGYKQDNKFGVSYTAVSEHRLGRGNENLGDDFMVRPGQTYAVLTSAVEGDTHVTVYAPGIADWQKNKVYVTIRWVDVTWVFPPPAQARFGTEHVFTTKIFRASDKQPLAGYRVRYRLRDGPAAVFLPSQTTEYTAVSDLSGNAQVAIKQINPVPGINNVDIEIIRPPDPNAPSGAGIVIARGETSVEWLAPNVALQHTGPASAVLGQDITYNTTVQNTGQIETAGVTVTQPIPEGLEFVSAQPQAFNDGKQLVWTLGALAPGQGNNVSATYRTLRQGAVTSSAIMVTAEGQRDQKDVVTQVDTASLKVAITAPATGVIGQPINYQITVTNPGSGVLDSVSLTAQFDPNLVHEKGVNTLNLALGALQPQEVRSAQLVLTPKAAGKLGTRVIAASGNLSDSAEHFVAVQQPQIDVMIEGPTRRYVGRNADWTIRVKNPADAVLGNVMVRDRLPPELQFVAAGQNGQFANGEVVWNLGALQPREERVLQLTARATGIAKQAVQLVSAVSDSGARKDVQAAVEIFGLPTLRLEMGDQGDPADVGKRVLYQVTVTNTGTLPANDIEVKFTLPAEMKLTAVKGPTDDKATVAGPLVTFAKANNVAPQQKLVYFIEAEAVRAADARAQVEVLSPVLEGGPIFEQESTRIVEPAVGGAPLPPPPPKLE
jgi:uncharacterized repeat protein (TIGR01451 family)